MSKFLFIYHAPTTPAENTPSDPAEMEAVMGQWMEWAGRVGDGMVDFGTPLAGGVQVTPEGTSPSTREVVGYSIIEAADLDAALALAQASGQDLRVSDEVVDYIHGLTRGVIAQGRGSSFADEITPAADADAVERFAAYAGRTRIPA